MSGESPPRKSKAQEKAELRDSAAAWYWKLPAKIPSERSREELPLTEVAPVETPRAVIEVESGAPEIQSLPEQALTTPEAAAAPVAERERSYREKPVRIASGGHSASGGVGHGHHEHAHKHTHHHPAWFKPVSFLGGLFLGLIAFSVSFALTAWNQGYSALKKAVTGKADSGAGKKDHGGPAHAPAGGGHDH